ncbi:CBO0543 family protein [Paenibacillus hamazuiensis]|uniref:CBO0543 family protein n=1 Tax=Paenibacillus hamazuiensis TaxID=2936508 RepID=UPI00200D797C|nr:CBO0543 family protein [Paenibacillus hamazuiensis]
MQNQIDNMLSSAHQMERNWWLTNDLFTFPWWVIVFVNAFFLVLFIMFIDRRRTRQITLALLFGYAIVGVFDQTGKYFMLWSYPHQLVPFVANFNAVNFLAVPCIFAIMYQKFMSWKTFVIADLLAALVNAYIAEPIFVALGIYKLNQWSYTGSFIVLFLIGLAVKAITDGFGKESYSNEPRESWRFPIRQKAR